MTSIHTFSTCKNYYTQKIQTILNNASLIQKTCHFSIKTFAAFDLYSKGVIENHYFTEVLQSTIDLFNFYSSYKRIIFWINPFTTESMDQPVFLTSLEFALREVNPESNELENEAKLILTKILSCSSLSTKKEVREVVRQTLETQLGLPSVRAQQIACEITIQPKARPLMKYATMTCFTFVDISSNILTLQKWKMINLTKVAAHLSNQSRGFAYIMNFGPKIILGNVSSVGLFLSIGTTLSQIIIYLPKLRKEENEEAKKEIRTKLKGEIIDLVSSGLDLAAVAAPLALALSPPAVVALGLISKGTGIICLFLKD